MLAPHFSYFSSKFNLKLANNYQTFVFFDTQGFSYIIQDQPSKNILALEIYKTNTHLLSLISEVLEQKTAILNEIKSTQIFNISSNNSLIPSAIYDAQKSEELYAMEHVFDKKQMLLRTESLEKESIECVYAMDKAIFDLLTGYFNQPIIKTHLPYLFRLIKNYPFAKPTAISMGINLISQTELEIVVFKEQELLFYNAFCTETTHDVLYYLTMTSNVIDFDINTNNTIILGDINNKSLEELLVYYPNIVVASKSKQPKIKGLAPHQWLLAYECLPI